MTDRPTPETTESAILQTAFQGIAQSVAASIVAALEQPLRQEIESRVNSIIADATRDIHQKIAAAIGHIQPIQIPINLLAQPLVQPLQPAAPAQPATTAAPTPAPAPISVPVAAKPQSQPPAAAKPEQSVEFPPVAEESEKYSDDAPIELKRDRKRTPQKSGKNVSATIVGLLPGQAHLIKNEFKHIKLSFVSADAGNSKQLRSLSKSNNPVIFMTDFIRHASVESVRAANGSWIYATGGLSSLREKLRELHQETSQNSLLRSA
ncbi:hypothetical protein [Melaminivora jejuensis]|uniref:hypothetical protein n=1 Tax=Melaminivora jejuensis TaxID=1267217 RepID=UPI001ADFEA92|nr:hypothetical protein [Melaminivora jejuensis]UHJ64155.1 hypothetical protein LVC68_12350 [Melaminivora jejuensis]